MTYDQRRCLAHLDVWSSAFIIFPSCDAIIFLALKWSYTDFTKIHFYQNWISLSLIAKVGAHFIGDSSKSMA